MIHPVPERGTGPALGTIDHDDLGAGATELGRHTQADHTRTDDYYLHGIDIISRMCSLRSVSRSA